MAKNMPAAISKPNNAITGKKSPAENKNSSRLVLYISNGTTKNKTNGMVAATNAVGNIRFFINFFFCASKTDRLSLYVYTRKIVYTNHPPRVNRFTLVLSEIYRNRPFACSMCNIIKYKHIIFHTKNDRKIRACSRWVCDFFSARFTPPFCWRPYTSRSFRRGFARPS